MFNETTTATPPATGPVTIAGVQVTPVTLPEPPPLRDVVAALGARTFILQSQHGGFEVYNTDTHGTSDILYALQQLAHRTGRVMHRDLDALIQRCNLQIEQLRRLEASLRSQEAPPIMTAEQARSGIRIWKRPESLSDYKCERQVQYYPQVVKTSGKDFFALVPGQFVPRMLLATMTWHYREKTITTARLWDPHTMRQFMHYHATGNGGNDCTGSLNPTCQTYDDVNRYFSEWEQQLSLINLTSPAQSMPLGLPPIGQLRWDEKERRNITWSP